MAKFLDDLAKLAAPVLNPDQVSTPVPVLAQDKANLSTSLAQIGNALNNRSDLADMTLAQDRNRGTDNQILLDRQTMGPAEFSLKYGPNIMNQLDELDMRQNTLRREITDTRTPNQRSGDDLVAVGSGALQSVLGVAQFGSLALGPKASEFVSNVSGGAKEITDGLQSEQLNDARFADAIRTEQDHRKNRAKFESEKKDGEFVASLRMVGRDVLDGAGRLGEDPRLLETGVSEGLGSMLVGGPGSKLITKGAGTLGGALERAGAKKAAQILEKTAEKAAFPAIVGAMEGGSVKTQTFQQVMATPISTLVETSPRFNQLMESGLSAEDARRTLAEESGNIALALTTPVAAATGKLVEGFEASPKALAGIGGSIRQIPMNMLKEGVEETIQSGFGQLAGNIGMKVSGANPNQNLVEGVGDQAVQGGLFGSLSAGLTSSPGAYLSDGAKLVGYTAKSAKDAVIGRSQKILSDNEKNSPVSSENMKKAMDIAVQNVGPMIDGLRNLITKPAQKGEAQPTEAAQDQAQVDPVDPEAEAYVQRVQNQLHLQEEDWKALPARMQEELQNYAENDLRRPSEDMFAVPNLNRFEALDHLAKIAGDEKADVNDRISAAMFIISQIKSQNELFSEDLPAFLDNVSHEHPAYQAFSEYASILQGIKQTKSVREAMKWAMTDMVMPKVDVASMDAVEQAQTVNNVVDIAQHMPQATNPEVAKDVLTLAHRGDYELTPEQTQALESAITLAQARESGVDVISRQIGTEGGLQPHMLSLAQHRDAIQTAARRGDKQAVRQSVQHLGLFARHMRNKVIALNESASLPGRPRVAYEALGPGLKTYTDKKGVGYGTEAFAKSVYANAVAAVTLSNQMNRLHPEAGVKDITLPELAQINKNNQGSSSQNTKTRVETKTEAKVEKPKVKAERDENPDQLELPLPEPDPAKPSEPVQETASEEKPNAATTQRRQGFKDQVTDQIEAERLAARQEEQAVEASPTEGMAPVNEQVTENAQQDNQENKEEIGGLKSQFPRLIAPAGKNKFLQAFRFPETQRSEMVQVENPLKHFKNMLNQSRNDLSKDARAGYRRMFEAAEEISGVVAERLWTLMQKGKEGGSLLDRLNKGVDVTRYRNGRVLAIMEKTDRGYKYNSQLMETAVVASIDWLINAANHNATIEAKDVAEIMGIDEGAADSLMDQFEGTISLTQAVRTLADNIQSFWGLQANPNMDQSYVRGIPEAVAKEILHALLKTDLIEVEQVSAPVLSVRKPYRIRFDKRSKPAKAVFAQVWESPTFIQDHWLNEREPKGVSVGKPFPKDAVARQQLRNPLVNNTAQNLKAIENEQNVEYFPNILAFNFFRNLGDNPVNAAINFMLLAGGRDFKPGQLNQAHARSMEGKNRGLVASFNNMLAQMAAVRRYAEENDLSPEEVASYYEHQITRAGRLQMMGLFNPQGDKLAREIFMSTKAILDLTKDEDVARFFMTVGQGLGIKTEKHTRAVVVDEVASHLTPEGKFFPLVQEVKAWLKAGGDTTVPQSIQQVMREAKLSMHGIHSILALAKYDLAFDQVTEKGDLSGLQNFETFNYLEADGKTNGPINALMLFAAGEFNPAFLALVAKGGAFFGKLNQTLNSWGDKVDLYDMVARKTAELVNAFGKSLKSDPQAHAQFQAFQDVLTALNGDVTVENGELVIGRGLTKNPLTISIYGSGIDGIAGKVTGELVEIFYQKLSDALSGDETTFTPEFLQNLKTILDTVPYRDKETGELKFRKANLDSNYNPETFEFSAEQFKALKSNVRLFLVDHLNEAIQIEVMGHVSGTTSKLQQATQIQSIVFKAMFKNAIIKALAKKNIDPDKHDYHVGDFLSENELKAILKSLLPYSPFITTGTQSYFMAGGETSDLLAGEGEESDRRGSAEVTIDGKTVKVSQPDSFSHSLSGEYRTAALVYGPVLAGVRAIPLLTIGSGDGQMMLNAAVDQSIDRVLKVFDGMNMPADAIDGHSRKINQAVFQTWTQNNPIRAVAESFSAFVRNNPTKDLLSFEGFNTQREDFIYDISKVIHGTIYDTETKKSEPRQLASPTEIQETLVDLVRGLNRTADEIDVRQQVIREMPLSVDQMASGENPYVQEGSIEISEGMTFDEISEKMNERCQQILDDKNLNKAKRKAVEKENQAFADAVEELASLDADSGARVIDPRLLAQVTKALPESMTGLQRELLGSALSLLYGSGYRLVIGSAQQLDAWEQNNNADRYVPGSNTGYGKIDPVAKIITVSNLVPETVVHELIHATTFTKVKAYYDNPSLLAQEDRQAVGRIEGLMQEWLGQRYDAENQMAQDARAQAFATVNGLWGQGRKAEAVNEFMAWVLANKNLAQLAHKTKVKNPLLRILGQAFDMLKTLIQGKKLSRAGEDMLSNLKFNTQVLMQTPGPVDYLKNDFTTTAMHHSPVFGSNQRLTDLREWFDRKIVSYVTQQYGIPDPVAQSKADLAQGYALEAALSFSTQGFWTMDMQQLSTFQMIAAALALETNVNKTSLSRIQDVYDHVINELKLEDFMADAKADHPADRYQAQQKYNALTGVFLGNLTDEQGKSFLLSSFLALAMVHDDFRKVLAKMETPKDLKDSSDTLDAHVTNVGTNALGSLSRWLSGDVKDGSAQASLDALTRSLLTNVNDQRTFMEAEAGSLMDRGDKIAADFIQKTSKSAYDKADEVANTADSKLAKGLAIAVRSVASVINEAEAERVALGVTQWMNQTSGFIWARDVLSDIIGRTSENAPLFDMISKVRSYVQQTRQTFREKLPAKIESKFTRKLTKAEKTALFHGMAKTDLASLYSFHGVKGALKILADQRLLKSEIKTLEAQIQKSQGSDFTHLQEKSKQLANYMNNGEHGFKLLRNAYAIARLSNEVKDENPALVDQIDRLVTLYALQGLNKTTQEALVPLVQNQSEGMGYALSYLSGLRNDEQAKAVTTKAKFNAYKGFIPSDQQQGTSLIVASDSEHKRLVGMGYVKLEAYVGSSADRSLGKRSYYYSPVTGRAAFNQGVMQMVHQTVGGVDPETGYTVGELTAGRIDDPKIVGLILRQLNNQRQTDENLLPVYDGNGDIVAFDRGVDPKQLARLNRSTDLPKMIGVWAGRQQEEALAQETNRALVEVLHNLWLQGKKEKRANEFVDLSRSKDPVDAEVWKLIPASTKQMIKETFGSEGFFVRNDMRNDAVGYRSASVGDLFTENTRWKPAVTQRFEEIALGIFGNKAYSRLVTAEKVLQDVVAEAKVLIVVKSVVVPVANIMSNMYQLMIRGVPLRHVVEGMGAKTVELNGYIKRREQEISLQADLLAARGINDTVQIRKLETRIQAIQDSYKALSIWPLIQAGEFSAISTGHVTVEDVALSGGKWATYVEGLVNKLPDGLKTVGRYGLITRDTALFQGLARAVQYGDFLAKAVLYDDLTKRKKLSSKDALVQISEEFVNYNRLAGRSRQYLESVGLLWFYNFKLRSLKTAGHMLRHHPLRALLSMAANPSLPMIGDIGSPLTDNLMSVGADGRLGYSIGPNMGLNAHTLSPWINLIK